jgi:hypothetical protein
MRPVARQRSCTRGTADDSTTVYHRTAICDECFAVTPQLLPQRHECRFTAGFLERNYIIPKTIEYIKRNASAKKPSLTMWVIRRCTHRW